MRSRLRFLLLVLLAAPPGALASGAGAVADPEPADPCPVVGDPVERDPVEGDPVEGDPVEGDPVEGDPVEGDPAATGVEGEPTAETPAAPAPWNPSPFEAIYEVRYDGVPFAAKGVRRLTPAANGTLRFEATIETWFLGVQQVARFRLEPDGRFVSLSYDYRQDGIGRNRRRILDFDHDAGVLRRSGDRERERPLDEGLFDPVSWQIALRRDLAEGRAGIGDVLHYPVTDGGDAKIYRMAVRGPEPATLAEGTEEAVLVERLLEPGDERRTRVWLSPERDWLLVRLEHTDDDGRTLRLALRYAEQLTPEAAPAVTAER